MEAKEISFDAIMAVAGPLIKFYEGLRLKPYLCSAGVPTIGYGSTFYLDGRKVSLKDPAITKEVAESLFINTIKTIYLPAVLQLCPTLETPHQVAAILSWTYNLGTTRLKNSTLRKRILAKEWSKVGAEILKWNIAGGKVSNGLVKRRRAEVEIFDYKQLPLL